MDKPTKDGKKVSVCLKKGLKIAKKVQVQLFVGILNHYVLFYEAGCENTTIEIMSEIVKLVWKETTL